MQVVFSDEGWDDYRHWADTDRQVLIRVNGLIENARRTPHSGLGKPEPLKGDLAGWWSRRITGEHRLIYRVAGRRGEDQRIEIIQCRFHY